MAIGVSRYVFLCVDIYMREVSNRGRSERESRRRAKNEVQRDLDWGLERGGERERERAVCEAETTGWIGSGELKCPTSKLEGKVHVRRPLSRAMRGGEAPSRSDTVVPAGRSD